MGDNTPKKTPKDSNLRPAWEKGQSGNPKGRPKGSRNKLVNNFIKALHEDFKKNGAEAIERVRQDKPEAYLVAVGKLVPKEMDHKSSDGSMSPQPLPWDEMYSKDDSDTKHNS